jgi:hypothetical protein
MLQIVPIFVMSGIEQPREVRLHAPAIFIKLGAKYLPQYFLLTPDFFPPIKNVPFLVL